MRNSSTMEDLDYLDFLLKFSKRSKGGLIKLKRSVRGFLRGKEVDLERELSKDNNRCKNVSTTNNNNHSTHNYHNLSNKK